jgi:hypothetical protein
MVADEAALLPNGVCTHFEISKSFVKTYRVTAAISTSGLTNRTELNSIKQIALKHIILHVP